MLLATEESSMSSLRSRVRPHRPPRRPGRDGVPRAWRDGEGGRPRPALPVRRAADWIGTPASWESLRGRVVLLDVWTFACSNCRATMPWLKDVRQKYAAQGSVCSSVSTPPR